MAVDVGEDLLGERYMDLIPVNDSLRSAGWELFKTYRDRGFSLTDCTSLAVLRKYGWSGIFTFDGEFRKVGTRTFPDPKEVQ